MLPITIIMKHKNNRETYSQLILKLIEIDALFIQTVFYNGAKEDSIDIIDDYYDECKSLYICIEVQPLIVSEYPLSKNKYIMYPDERDIRFQDDYYIKSINDIYNLPKF